MLQRPGERDVVRGHRRRGRTAPRRAGGRHGRPVSRRQGEDCLPKSAEKKVFGIIPDYLVEANPSFYAMAPEPCFIK